MNRSKIEPIISGKLIEAQEKERARIGRELHDDIGQRLALLVIELDKLQHQFPKLNIELDTRMGQLREKLEEVVRDVHTLSHDMHPSKLEYLGLVPAIRGFCRDFSDNHLFEVDLECAAIPEGIPSETALCLFRVLQESIHNSQKHSGADRCQVRLWASAGRVYLTVCDSGRGFEKHESPESRGGLGLISINERLKSVGGTFSIESQPLRGTMVRVSVPFENQRESGFKKARARPTAVRVRASQGRQGSRVVEKAA